jgi:hypothetical protein
VIRAEDLAVMPSPEPSVRTETAPNYLLAFVFGLIAALIAMPIHRLIITGTYHNGYYTDWHEVQMLPGLLVGAAVRFGSRKHGITLGILAFVLTVFSLIGSEYLTAHYLIAQYGLENGYGTLPLLLNPIDMIGIVIDSLVSQPITIFVWLVTLIMALVITIPKQFGRQWSAAASASRISTLRGQPTTGSLASPEPVTILPTSFSIDPTVIPNEAIAMGSPVRHYSTGLPSLIPPVIGIVLGIGLVVLRFTTGMAPFLILVIFPILFAVYKMFAVITATDDQVLVFQKGLSITQKGKTVTFDWTDVVSLFEYRMIYRVNGIPVRNVHDFTLSLKDGRKIVLGRRFKKIVELGEVIHSKVTEIRLPIAIEAFKRGETLDFGAYIINREGIRGLYSDQVLTPWPQVQDVRIVNGFVQIHRHGKSPFLRNGTSTGRVANIRVFLTMIENIIASLQSRVAP